MVITKNLLIQKEIWRIVVCIMGQKKAYIRDQTLTLTSDIISFFQPLIRKKQLIFRTNMYISNEWH